MTKIILWIGKFAFIIAIAMWFADNPGYVDIQWFDWQIQTSMGILLLGILLCFWLLFILLNMVKYIWNSPQRYRLWMTKRSEKSAHFKLAQMQAMNILGLYQKSQKISQEITPSLHQQPLFQLMNTHNQHDFKHPDFVKAHYCQQAKQALDIGDYQQALDILLPIHQKTTLFNYPKPSLYLCHAALQCHDYGLAQQSFDILMRKFHDDPEITLFCQEQRMVLHHLATDHWITEKNTDKLYALIKKHGNDIGEDYFMMAMGYLLANKELKKALNSIEQRWCVASSQKLAAIFLNAIADQKNNSNPALARFQYIANFVKKHPDLAQDISSDYLLALSAGEADLPAIYLKYIEKLAQHDDESAQIGYNHLFRLYHHYHDATPALMETLPTTAQPMADYA